MKERELLDDVAYAARDVGVVGTREPAPARYEILEDHHMALSVGLRKPHPGTRTGISRAMSR